MTETSMTDAALMPAVTAVDMSPLALFLAADIVVKLVMLGLLAASVWSWAIILDAGGGSAAINAQATAFEEHFWAADSVDPLYDPRRRRRTRRRGCSSPGWTNGGADPRPPRRQRSTATASRARLATLMGAAIAREIDALSDRLNILATVGSVAPFVGLFGTVWGIMRAFTAIAATQNTSLAVVAPGIAEALFATAIGLFAAIPAVIGYNRLLHGLSRFEARLRAFADEFHALLSRQLDGRDAEWRWARRARGGRRAPMAEINVTPMVDVMLVLLIIFMVTAPLLVAGVPVDLPDSRAERARQADDKPIAGLAGRAGRGVHRRRGGAEGALPGAACGARTRRARATRRVFVRADRALEYGRVMRSIGELDRAGFQQGRAGQHPAGRARRR